ncbi:MAG: VanZ family protein [Chitinophagaceae bacterium]
MKFLKWTGTVTYFSLLVYIVFLARRRRHLTDHFYNLVPIKRNLRYLFKAKANHEGYNYFVNLLGNIGLFIPFSIILILVFRIKNAVAVMLSAFFFSLCIELIQYVFYLGVADIDDILLNTFGALTGLVIYRLFQRFSRQANRASLVK